MKAIMISFANTNPERKKLSKEQGQLFHHANLEDKTFKQQ